MTSLTNPSIAAVVLTLLIALGGAHLARARLSAAAGGGATLRATKQEAPLLGRRLGLGLNNRVLQRTGSVSGSSEVSGIVTGAGSASNMNVGMGVDPLAVSSGFGTATTSNNGSSQGIVMTNYGQAQGNSGAASSGASSGSGMTALLAQVQADPILIDANSAGSAGSAGSSFFSASFDPNDANDSTTAVGLGSGSAAVLGAGSGGLVSDAANFPYVGQGTFTDNESTSAGTSAAGASATASNGSGAAAGGAGSGSTEGSAVEGGSLLLVDRARTGNSLPTEFSSSGASSGVFDSTGQGSAGVRGGSASGASNGGGTANNAGTAAIAGLRTMAGNDFDLQAAGAGMFASNAGSSGFGQSMLGGAVGSGAAGANGSTAGGGEVVATETTFDGTTFNVAGSVDSAGSGGFVAVFNPDATTPTGGSGSGNGSLNVVQSAAGSLVVFGMVVQDAETSAATTGSASNFGGGVGVGSTIFGSAGSIGSGESSGSAGAGGNAGPVTTAGAIPKGTLIESFMSVGSATGDFGGAGESFFGGAGSSLVLQFP